jgi:hypothetical protein
MSHRDSSFLHALGYLYLAFAHLTDRNLSSPELTTIRSKLVKWMTAAGKELVVEDFNTFVHEVAEWYSDTRDERFNVFQDIAFRIADDSRFDDAVKTQILKDLTEIAVADNQFGENEKGIINLLSETWNLDFSV